jgi:Fe-S oxidoreductase
MCPSYRVTREEQHSTRGRARLLFEMLQGNPLTGGWRDEHVKDALDLCLACKGCKSDCPVHVDMATYKAEFLSHYYEGRLRPRSAYAMGYVHRWARLASQAPAVVNAVTHAPGLSALFKWLGGVAPQREVPQFAESTFVDWFRRNRRSSINQQSAISNRQSTDVVLWPDTFNNFFLPQTAIAATEVLEASGCEVTVPAAPMCCGRPLYDYGFLGEAKQRLRDVMRGMRQHLDAGTPIVVLEPSCLAVFRDELVNLFPNDEDAKRLSSQTVLLSEFLRKQRPQFRPRLPERVLLHGHCHHKAIATLADEEALLREMGADLESLDSGCCGMAGSFGFEADHFIVSQQVGELVLLPAVRRAAADTLIVADGFSCREQIAQGTRRRAVHLADALALALRGQRAGRAGRAEDACAPAPVAVLSPRQVAAAALIGAAAVMLAVVAARAIKN